MSTNYCSQKSVVLASSVKPSQACQIGMLGLVWQVVLESSIKSSQAWKIGMLGLIWQKIQEPLAFEGNEEEDTDQLTGQ